MRLLVLFLTQLFISMDAQAQTTALPDACELRPTCAATCVPSACSQVSDSRDCTIRINTPFGAIRGAIDPSCEAARAAQNTLYQIQKADCERINNQVMSTCLAQQARCLSVAATCDSLKRKIPQINKREPRILWVDDNPTNNTYEQNALAKLGAKLVLVKSTTEAMEAIERERFDIVISDFSRRDDPQGGYTLLAELKRSPSTKSIPYLIFSSASTPESIADARSKGAYTQTNIPADLLESVFRVLFK